MLSITKLSVQGSVQQTVSNKKNINIKHGMNEKTSNKNSGLVDYKELENNILSSIRETNWKRRNC